MRYCCVTPCYNAGPYIEHTMLSVLTQTVFQNQNHQLHYIIKDGGSSDDTLKKINKIAFDFSNFTNITIEVISKTDNGMYDALAESFSALPDGDVYSYINAGDYYSLYAFEIVAEIFNSYDVHFLTGLSCVYNEKNHLLSSSLPFRYKKELLLSGYYGTLLPHIQQESTFWDSELHKTIDLELLKNTKLAGDYLLWKTFINHRPLFIVSAHLGGFKIHKGQLTEYSKIEYKNELRALADSGTIYRMLTALYFKLLWYFPNRIKKILSCQIFEYDHLVLKYKISSRK